MVRVLNRKEWNAHWRYMGSWLCFCMGTKTKCICNKKCRGLEKRQVIIAFETDAAFENDPGIKNPEIIFYQSLRSVFPGPVIIKNVRVVN